MPIYEHRCNHCGNKFEVIRGEAKKDEASQCEFCGTYSDHQRLVSNCHFQFTDGLPSYIDDTVPDVGEEFDYHSY